MRLAPILPPRFIRQLGGKTHGSIAAAQRPKRKPPIKLLCIHRISAPKNAAEK
jgi:hypothetical protein